MEHTKNETIIHDTDKESSWEQQTAMKVSGISILVNLLLSIFKLIAGSRSVILHNSRQNYSVGYSVGGVVKRSQRVRH